MGFEVTSESDLFETVNPWTLEPCTLVPFFHPRFHWRMKGLPLRSFPMRVPGP